MRSSSPIATTIVVGLLVTACASAPSSASNTAPSSTPASVSESATPSATPLTALPSASIPARAPTWTATGSMTAARIGHTATLLRDGTVLVVGGYDGEGPPIGDSAHPLATAELSTQLAVVGAPQPRMSTARAGHTATLLPDGRVLVVGGGPRAADGGTSSECHGRAVRPEHQEMGSHRHHDRGPRELLGHAVAQRHGARSGRRRRFREAELYDPQARDMGGTGSMAEGRMGHSATLLPDGTVLVTGGCACSEPNPDRAPPSCTTRAPGNGRPPDACRRAACSTSDPLVNGRVLVAPTAFR